jgi:hypothetical protein
MSDEKIHFLEEATRRRRLAAWVNDAEAVAHLIELAEEYISIGYFDLEAQAARTLRTT